MPDKATPADRIGARAQDVAASLYIHPFMLSRWRKWAREGRIMTKDVAVDQAVTAELEELRRVSPLRLIGNP